MFKVMLASDADLTKLRFPLLASPKLDGIRAYVRDGLVLSRSNKPIPNKNVQRKFSGLKNFDGELIVGEPTSKTVYRDTVSVVMSHDAPAVDVQFFAFDHIAMLDCSYVRRRDELDVRGHNDVFEHEQQLIWDEFELQNYEEVCLNKGYEGLILRDPNGRYKCGRSTAREGLLLKLKRFVDAEATVVGFEERMHNGNEATTNELGRTKRSSHKENKTGRGDLGALVVEMNGVRFNIGTGFLDSERAEIWANQEKYLGTLAKFKYFPIGVKDAPRHPVFLGWRDRSDM